MLSLTSYVFNIYTNEMQILNCAYQLYKYADDMVLISLCRQGTVNQSINVHYIGELPKWCEDDAILINQSKTKQLKKIACTKNMLYIDLYIAAGSFPFINHSPHGNVHTCTNVPHIPPCTSPHSDHKWSEQDDAKETIINVISDECGKVTAEGRTVSHLCA